MCKLQALAGLTPDCSMLQSEVAYEYFRDRFSVTSQQPCSQARHDNSHKIKPQVRHVIYLDSPNICCKIDNLLHCFAVSTPGLAA